MAKSMTTTSMALPRWAYFQLVKRLTIKDSVEVMQLDDEPCWIDPLINFLRNGTHLVDRKAAHKVKYQASRYLLHEAKLYKRLFFLPLLRCLHPSEDDYVLREVHEGTCRSHIGKKALAYKIFWQSYYWHVMQKDAEDFVMKYDAC